MATDVLCKKIRGISPVKDLSLGSASMKLQQYADDTTVFLTDPSEVNHALQLIQNFSSHSNLQINKKKTQFCLTTSIFQKKLKSITVSQTPERSGNTWYSIFFLFYRKTKLVSFDRYYQGHG